MINICMFNFVSFIEKLIEKYKNLTYNDVRKYYHIYGFLEWFIIFIHNIIYQNSPGVSQWCNG